MGWKAFLKPTAEKILLASFLFILLVPFIEYDTGIRCIRAPCPSSTSNSALVYAYYALIVFPNTSIYAINYQMLAIGPVLSYILACLLAHVYPKNAKRKK